MKKRSMLAFASLAVGVVASLTAPSAHAAAGAELGPHDTHGHTSPDLGSTIGSELQHSAHKPGNTEHHSHS